MLLGVDIGCCDKGFVLFIAAGFVVDVRMGIAVTIKIFVDIRSSDILISYLYLMLS